MSIESFKEDDSKKYENAIFANGIWQKRKEPVGEFIVKLDDIDGTKLGLSQTCQFSFRSSLPKMPHTLLNNILEFYREVYSLYSSEVYISVYWDKRKQDYFLYVPKQEVSGATVRFENDETMLNNEDYFIVMDSHSHNVMGAFWSAQDRADQAASRLFSVLGKITSANPEILITAGSNRQEVRLKLDDAFDFEKDKLHEDSDYSIPANAMSQVSEYRYTPPVYGGYQSTYPNVYPGYGNTKGKGNTTTPSNKKNTPVYTGLSEEVKAKNRLITDINSYLTLTTVSTARLQALFTCFLEFVEHSTLAKDTSYVDPALFEKGINEISTEVEFHLDYLNTEILGETDPTEKAETLTVEDLTTVIVPDPINVIPSVAHQDNDSELDQPNPNFLS